MLFCSPPQDVHRVNAALRRSGTHQSIFIPAKTLLGTQRQAMLSQQLDGQCWVQEPSPEKKTSPPRLSAVSEEAGTLLELAAARVGGNNPALCGSCREKKPPRNAGEVRQPQAAFCPVGRALGGGTNRRAPSL